MRKKKSKYGDLLKNIRQIIERAKQNVLRNINTELLFTCWSVGRLIVAKEHYEKYDETSLRNMFDNISKELTKEFGKGFSRSQLVYMRLFFLKFPNFELPAGSGLTVSNHSEKKGSNPYGLTVSNHRRKRLKTPSGLTVSNQQQKKAKKASGLTVSNHLSWSHYHELLKCTSEEEMSFYQHKAIDESWSIRELRRQINTSLYERVLLGKSPKNMKRMIIKRKNIEVENDLGKDPFVLEFVDLPSNAFYTEKELEQKIIDNLQKFILELGKGFTFVARQFRIKLKNKFDRVDLVFYNRISRFFLLIDLKIRAVEHRDIGQMNLYLNYFEDYENVKGDNKPVGIILSSYKDDVTVKYSTRGITNKIFVSKYQLYLPDKKILTMKIKELLTNI